ncbi:MAG: PH domain-containing protein [Gammaproteobacteria bacterium]
MSYVNSTLLPGEKIILKAHIHWIVLINAFIAWLIAAAVFVGHDYGIVERFAESVSFVLSMPLTVERLRMYEAGAAMLVGIYAVGQTVEGLIRYVCTEFAVTNERVIVKVGFIRLDTHELNVNRVTSLNVDQSILGRILNYGDITVEGMGGTLTPIRAVVDPLRFRRYMLTEVEGTKIE